MKMLKQLTGAVLKLTKKGKIKTKKLPWIPNPKKSACPPKCEMHTF